MTNVDLYSAGLMYRILNPERYNLYHKIYNRKQKLKKVKDSVKREKLLKEIDELTKQMNAIPVKTPSSLGFNNISLT